MEAVDDAADVLEGESETFQVEQEWDELSDRERPREEQRWAIEYPDDADADCRDEPRASDESVDGCLLDCSSFRVEPGTEVVEGGVFDAFTLSGFLLYVYRRGLGAPRQYCDPVCGMRTGDSGPRSTHDGEPYYFCSNRCKQAFEKHPDEFAQHHPPGSGTGASQNHEHN